MPKFLHHASSNFIGLFSKRSRKVSSELRAPDPSYGPNDSITYALNIIGHAFAQSGKVTATTE